MNYEDRVTKEYVENALAAAGNTEVLLDVTIPSNTAEYALDVSGVDFTAYDEVHLYHSLTGTEYMVMHVNGVDTGGAYVRAENHNQTMEVSSSPNRSELAYLYPGWYSRYRFVGTSPSARVTLRVDTFFTTSHSLRASREFNCAVSTTWPEFHTLNLSAKSNTTIAAGGHIVLVGVKKPV